MATGNLRFESTPPGSTTVRFPDSVPLILSLTETVASVTRERSTQTLLVSTQLPIAITSDWLVMSSSESATVRVVSGVPRESEGGASTALVPHWVETSKATSISKQLTKVNFFMLACLSKYSESCRTEPVPGGSSDKDQ